MRFRKVPCAISFAFLLLTLQTIAFGQTAALEGRVTNKEGEPVAGATVRLEGTNMGAVGDARGVFALRRIPEGNYTLEVSSIGFVTATRKVALREGEITRLRVELSTEAVRADAIVVVSRRGYYDARAANTATRSAVRIAETPVSVQVVTKQLIEDQAAIELTEVFKNVSGVTESGATLNASTIVQPHIRGFISQTFFRDGQRTTISGSGAIDLVNVESVEILKGPASILFGALEPGGVINYTIERPQPFRRTTIRQEFGSYDHFRTVLDATGPLDDEASVLYRINAAYTDAESFRDVVETERFTLAPSLSIRPSDRLDLTLDVSYGHEETPFDVGVPFTPDGTPVASIETFFSPSTLEPREMDSFYAGHTLRWQLGDAWELRNSASFYHTETSHEAIRHTGLQIPDEGPVLVTRRFQAQEQSSNQIQIVTDVSRSLRTGGIGHDLLFGLELHRFEVDDAQFRQRLDPFELGTIPTDFTVPEFDFPEDDRSETDWIAVFAQDQITLAGDRLHLLLTGRFDAVEQGGDGPRFEEIDDFTDEKFTGRGGVLYEATPVFALFASVSQSFNPQTPGIVDVEDNPLGPEEGIQVEGGVKFETRDRNLSATIATYRIEKDNVPVFDFPTFRDTGVVSFVPDVRQRSAGLEIDVAGEIAPGLRLLANYAFTDTETTESPDEAEEGEELGGVPEHAGRFWLAYDFRPDSDLAGLGLGGGARFEGSHLPSFLFGPEFELDDFTVIDFAAWYALVVGQRRIKLQVNVDNVFDEEHFLRANDASMVHPGEPRSGQASITLEL